MINSMVKCYLDANILINFKNIDSSFHKQTKELLTKLANTSSELCVSSLTLDEFLYQLRWILIYQKQKDIFRKLSLALRSILDLPKLTLVNPSIERKDHLKIIKYMEDYNLRPRDAYHLSIMKNNKITHFATFDQDFKKVFKNKTLTAML